MKKIALIGLVGLILITTNCKSQEAKDTTSKKGEMPLKEKKNPFIKMDTNKDGLLTKTEVKGPIANDFDKIDLDKDGIITREEFDKAPKPKRRGGNRPPRK